MALRRAKPCACLSNQIEKALREVILDAKHEEELQTTARAERIFSSASNDNSDDRLKDELRLQQRFIKAYPVLQAHQPERLHKLELRMMRFEEELNQAGVDPDELSPPGSTLRVFKAIIKRSILFLLMLGPALIGTIAHYPAYKLGGFLATRISRDSDDVISTVKIISAMLLFPLTWLIIAIFVYTSFGWIASTSRAGVDSVLWLRGDCFLRRAGQVSGGSAGINVLPGEKTFLRPSTRRTKSD